MSALQTQLNDPTICQVCGCKIHDPKDMAEIERLKTRLDNIAKHPDVPLLIKQYASGKLEGK